MHQRRGGGGGLKVGSLEFGGSGGCEGNFDRASTYLDLNLNLNFNFRKIVRKARPAMCTYPRQFTAVLLFPTFTQREKE